MPSKLRSSAIFNVTMTNSNTEYSKLLPDETKRILIKERSGTALVKIALHPTTATVYLTIPAGASKSIDGLFLIGKTLYFQSTSTGKILEIEVWI